jgi:hypothetical protein
MPTCPDGAILRRTEEVCTMEVFWTVVVYLFTVAVLGVIAYAFARVATMGRRQLH